MKEICLVIPTIRENCFLDFMRRWNDAELFEAVDLLVMEDNPSQTFSIPDNLRGITEISHFSWEDIKKDLGDKEWIIPRRSDTVRSYAYWKAWKLGYKYIMTLDDDCYPCDPHKDGIEYTGPAFVNGHLKNLTSHSRWFNTLNSVKPRGIPYYNKGVSKTIVLSHGLWTNVLDYDAPTQLVQPFTERFSYDAKIVPAGSYFPLCGMNVMWRADITVLMYHLLMGKRKTMLPTGTEDKDGLVKLPFDRFGDIWCGILMKKVVDYLGYQVTSGMPYIKHERASNPFTNLKKEANGIEVNEHFWEFIDNLSLDGVEDGSDPFVSAYMRLGTYMNAFTDLYPQYKEHEQYFRSLGLAMQDWAMLFAESAQEA